MAKLGSSHRSPGRVPLILLLPSLSILRFVLFSPTGIEPEILLSCNQEIEGMKQV